MSSHTLYQGVHFLLRRILLQVSGNERNAVILIRKAYGNTDSDNWEKELPLDFLLMLDALNVVCGTGIRMSALTTIRSFRHVFHHANFTCARPLMFEIASAIAVLRKWSRSLSPPIDMLSSPSTEELLLDVLESWTTCMAESSPANSVQLKEAEQQRIEVPFTRMKVVAEQREIEVPVTRLKAVSPVAEEEVPLSEIVINDPLVELIDTLRNLRANGWREKLKGRDLKILDGKYAGVCCKLCYWSGTVALVKVKSDDPKYEKPIGIPIDKRVALSKK